jgi:hypothetical protein
VLCCAVPALIAGGVLAAGSVLSNPGLIGAAALLLLSIMLAAAVISRTRRVDGSRPEDCCPPPRPARDREEGPHHR